MLILAEVRHNVVGFLCITQDGASTLSPMGTPHGIYPILTYYACVYVVSMFSGRPAGCGAVPHSLPLLRGVYVRRQSDLATQLPLLPGATQPVHARYGRDGVLLTTQYSLLSHYCRLLLVLQDQRDQLLFMLDTQG